MKIDFNAICAEAMIAYRASAGDSLRIPMIETALYTDAIPTRGCILVLTGNQALDQSRSAHIARAMGFLRRVSVIQEQIIGKPGAALTWVQHWPFKILHSEDGKALKFTERGNALWLTEAERERFKANDPTLGGTAGRSLLSESWLLGDGCEYPRFTDWA
jgi:hypothetical protein